MVFVVLLQLLADFALLQKQTVMDVGQKLTLASVLKYVTATRTAVTSRHVSYFL